MFAKFIPDTNWFFAVWSPLFSPFDLRIEINYEIKSNTTIHSFVSLSTIKVVTNS